jgi:HEPN domain-containing protein
MSAPPDLVAVVRSWVVKADEDLCVAERVLEPADGCPAASVGFHAQQCIEKYVKALLVWRGLESPKTHDLLKLLRLLPASARTGLSADEAETLTDYATVSRYPGEDEPLRYVEAKRAVQVARRTRQRVRKLLPKDALS